MTGSDNETDDLPFPQRLIYVDDDEDMRTIVRESLSRSIDDFVLVTCASGEELLHRLDEIQPDVILLDLSMPGMSGPDIMEKLQQNETYAKIPIIFMTGKDKVEMIDDYKALSVLGVIHKPFETSKLAEQISAIWNEHKT